MTKEEFDIDEPYRCYAYMMLVFDCHECHRYLDIRPAYGEHEGWQWFHDTAEQAWRAGWYVAPNLPDGSLPLFCLCPNCATRNASRNPVTRVAVTTQQNGDKIRPANATSLADRS